MLRIRLLSICDLSKGIHSTRRVKGRNEAVTLIEIFNEDIDPDYLNKLKIKTDYETAMLLYQQGEMAGALRLFMSISEILPNDKATKNYIHRDLQKKHSVLLQKPQRNLTSLLPAT